MYNLIKVKKQTSADEFFVPSLKTWIDLSSTDWTEVKISKCNVQMLFDKIKQSYFGQLLANAQYTIKWDFFDIIEDGTNYKVYESSKEILISTAALIRPRIQLISVLLHILIHLYLSNASKGVIKPDQHGVSFKKIMSYFNERIDTKISTVHSFIYSEDDTKFAEQFFQCTGICSNYQPFYGIIRCTNVPNETMNFWSRHHDKCGGMFFKIFEAQRKSNDGSIQRQFVRNVKYMNPRMGNSANSETVKPSKSTAHKPSLFVSAHIDLTKESPHEQNLCAIINLDESEFVANDSDEKNAECPYTQAIIAKSSSVLSKCFLCQQMIGVSRIASHFDSCTGFQQEVLFDKNLL